MKRWNIVTAIAATAFLHTATPLMAAEWTCEASEPIPGGQLHLVISGSDSETTSASGAVQLFTGSAPPPLGLRDGTYAWDAPQGEIAVTGGVLSLGFDVNLPIAAPAAWGAGEGDVVPSRLFFVLPALHGPTGEPIQLSGLTLISGNGIYNTNNDWSLRGGETGMLITNAPEPLSLVYSRELLQIISSDPNEPISLFITPANSAATDSIAAFHAGGIAIAPQRIAAMMSGLATSGGDCAALTPSGG